MGIWKLSVIPLAILLVGKPKGHWVMVMDKMTRWIQIHPMTFCPFSKPNRKQKFLDCLRQAGTSAGLWHMFLYICSDPMAKFRLFSFQCPFSPRVGHEKSELYQFSHLLQAIRSAVSKDTKSLRNLCLNFSSSSADIIPLVSQQFFGKSFPSFFCFFRVGARW